MLLAAVWLLVVAAAGIVLDRARARAHSNEQDDFGQRTRAAASFISAYAVRVPARQQGWAAAMLTGAHVTAKDLHGGCETIGFTACGLFDAHARLLMNSAYIPELLGKSFNNLPQVTQSLRTRQPTITAVTISPALKAPVVAFGLPYTTRYGVRVFTGIFSVQDSALVKDANLSFELPSTEIYVIDNVGNLAATTRGRLPAVVTSLASYDPKLASAVREKSHGPIGSRYYASSTIKGTPWRLVSTVRETALYSSIGSVATVALWAVACWAVAGLVAIVALVRALHRTEQTAARLTAFHSYNEERQRYAREVNDEIVQGLIAAEGALDLDDPARARALLRATSRNARRWIGELLADSGPLRPGDARRTSPVEAIDEREPVSGR